MWGLSSFYYSLWSCIFSSLDFMFALSTVIYAAKTLRKMLVKASLEQDNKKAYLWSWTAAKGQGAPGRVPLTLVSRTNPRADLLSKSSWAQGHYFTALEAKGCSPSPKGLMRRAARERPRESAEGDGRQRLSGSWQVISHHPTLSLETKQSKTTTTLSEMNVLFSSGLETLPK